MTASHDPSPPALPMHERIRQDIEGRILSGELRPGERIPSELELMAHYGCSRMTVNKALSRLAASGLLDRRKRAGTFVARPRTVSMVLDIPDLAQEVQGRGQAYGFRLLARQVGDTASDAEAAAELGQVGPILRLSGLHLADGAPLALEERVINLALVPGIADVDFTADPPGVAFAAHSLDGGGKPHRRGSRQPRAGPRARRCGGRRLPRSGAAHLAWS
jgi:GntR family histidine utilization transcriptional repressor